MQLSGTKWWDAITEEIQMNYKINFRYFLNQNSRYTAVNSCSPTELFRFNVQLLDLMLKLPMLEPFSRKNAKWKPSHFLIKVPLLKKFFY